MSSPKEKTVIFMPAQTLTIGGSRFNFASGIKLGGSVRMGGTLEIEGRLIQMPAEHGKLHVEGEKVMIEHEVYFDLSNEEDCYWPNRTATGPTEEELAAKTLEIERLRAMVREIASAEKEEPAHPSASARDDDDKGKCVVCIEADACIMIDPCKHVCLCEGCSVRWVERTCPMCRAGEVGKREKVFLM